MTKIYDIPYPIYDLTKNSKPFVLCIIVTICAVGTIFILVSDACVPCVYYKNGNFLRLLAVASSWIVQGTRTVGS